MKDQNNDPDSAGSVYADLVAEQLQTEENRKGSIEQRGIAVISTSGALVSLLFGLGAVAIGRTDLPSLPRVTRLLLIGATTAFIAASVLGLATNSPRGYLDVHTDELLRLLKHQFRTAGGALASWRVSEARIESLKRARIVNGTKASFLQAAIVAELSGITLIGASVVSLLMEP